MTATTVSSLFSKVFSRMSLGDLEAFITEQEKLASRSEPEREDSLVVRKYGSYLVDRLSGKHSREPGKNSARSYTEILQYIVSA